MISACNILGIYPAEIERAWEAVMSAFDKYSVDDSDFDSDVQKKLETSGSLSSINDSLLEAVFSTGKAYLVRYAGISENDVIYSINGWRSEFLVDSENFW